jgi:4-hydroxybenzoate polyprenyltransferase
MSLRIALLVRMMRVKVVVTLWTFLLIGLARHTEQLTTPRLAWAFLALAAGYATATTANDISDAEIDRVNRPAGRPLVSGDATVADLWRTNALASTVALGAAIPLGGKGLVVVAASLLVSYAYSVGPIRLSHRWTVAPVALAIAYVVIPYALGIVVADDGWSARDVPLVAGLSILFVARIVLKDLRDRLGDQRFGKTTPLLRLGKRATCVLSMAGAALGTAVVVGAVHPPAITAGMLGACGAGIVWMLLRLAVTEDERGEQVAIGIAARAGNGVLLGVLTILVLQGAHADERTTVVIVGSLLATIAVSFLIAALEPDRVRIGYKGRADGVT